MITKHCFKKQWTVKKIFIKSKFRGSGIFEIPVKSKFWRYVILMRFSRYIVSQTVIFLIKALYVEKFIKIFLLKSIDFYWKSLYNKLKSMKIIDFALTFN